MGLRESNNVALVVLSNVEATKAKEMIDRVKQDLGEAASRTKLQVLLYTTDPSRNQLVSSLRPLTSSHWLT